MILMGSRLLLYMNVYGFTAALVLVKPCVPSLPVVLTLDTHSSSDQPEKEKRKQPREGKTDAKAMGKDIAEEVDTCVRDGQKPVGQHCDALVAKADEIAQQDKTSSTFKPTISPTPLEIYVTVHLKAKTLKRLLAKIAVLAGIIPIRTFIFLRMPLFWNVSTAQVHLKPQRSLCCILRCVP